MLEQNHWKSPAPFPSDRIPLPLQQSTSPVAEDDPTQQHDLSGSSVRKHNPTPSMDGAENNYSRRRRSQSTTEKEELSTYGETMELGSSDADEGYKSSTSSQNRYTASTGFGRPPSDKLESDGSSSEEDATDNEEAGLTRADRGRRRRRKRRHTSLDERVAGSPKISKKARKLADLSVLKSSAINALLIGLWYVASEAV